MAISEGEDDDQNDLIRYFYASANTNFLRTVVSLDNYNQIAEDIRRGRWIPNIERLMDNPNVESGSSFMFFTDFKITVDLLYN